MADSDGGVPGDGDPQLEHGRGSESRHEAEEIPQGLGDRRLHGPRQLVLDALDVVVPHRRRDAVVANLINVVYRIENC